MEERRFAAGRDFGERGGLGQLRRDSADEFVGADALTDGDFELLADGLANGQRDFDAVISDRRTSRSSLHQWRFVQRRA